MYKFNGEPKSTVYLFTATPLDPHILVVYTHTYISVYHSNAEKVSE